MRLTWQEINRSFRNQWVELIDVQWNEALMPTSAAISQFGDDRNELIAGRTEDGIIVYIGSKGGFVPMGDSAQVTA